MGDVSTVQLCGIDILGKTKLSDFSPMDAIKLTVSFSKGSLPVALILNVEAMNPKDAGGYANTNASITSFPYRVLINQKEILTGNIQEPIYIPGTGEQVNIPIQINFDLINSFKEKKYEDLINLALNISGAGGKPTNITFITKPTFKTEYGSFTYPSELVLEKEFKDK